MALTPEQRLYLDKTGTRVVTLHLERGSLAKGTSLDVRFLNGDTLIRMDLRDVESWLTEKALEEETQQSDTLRWAKIAGWAGIVGIVIALFALILSVLQSR